MRKNPALTYRGALRLLGKNDSKLVNALDTLLGGFILAAPASPLAALWGMVDQKNEAMSLVRKLVNGAAKRMNTVKGIERYDLITAAHTVIVIAAFFDAFHEAVGKREFARVRLSEREKAAIATGAAPPASASAMVNLLSSAERPHLAVSSRFYDPDNLDSYYVVLFDAIREFVRGLDSGAQIRIAVSRHDLVRIATVKYQGYFLELAKDVPEFFIWATVSGHQQIRREARTFHRELNAALDDERKSLRRLETILTHLSASFASSSANCRTIVARANRSVLAETVVPSEALDQITDVTFPTVERIYQSPQFRLAVMGQIEPANEKWWARQPVLAELDLFFATFLASPECVSAPLLLLGHPGAGKSLLTKVLAARLPESGYTAVRVPLRRVDADAPVYEQIQQALDLVTNRRVHWSDLVEDGHTTRVVFLDGLDELLQASSQGRASYLQEVAEFQRREADQNRPVVFVVTSRTVVADQVRIAPRTTLVKLEEFTDEQIFNWLGVWRDHNQDAISGGLMREVSGSVALRHRDLACQPLLLMMLAIYAADPAAPPLDAKMSNAAFYELILATFVHREVTKHHSGLDLTHLTEDQMWRLGIAAFAMFNRDRQDISDHELGLDILALTGAATRLQPGTVGKETIGKFFFVYTAEADAHRDHDVQRSYEFLHATFGEYLVAHYTVKVLCEMARASRSPLRGGREYDDDLIFALLSHQSLTTRQSIMNFVHELVMRLPEQVVISCQHVLSTLFRHYRHRPSTNSYESYQPMPVDHVRSLAAYSANLVILRILLTDQRVIDEPPLWGSTVELWRAGLGATGWESLSLALDRGREGGVGLRTRPLPPAGLELGFYQLLGAADELARHQRGGATEGWLAAPGTGSPQSDLESFLVRETLEPNEWTRRDQTRWDPLPTLKGLLERSTYDVHDPRLLGLVLRYLAACGANLAYEEAVLWLRLVVANLAPKTDLSEVAPVVATHPTLLVELPELAQPDRYNRWAVLVLLAAERASGQDCVAELRRFRAAIETHHDIANWDASRDSMLVVVRQMFKISDAVDKRRAAKRRADNARGQSST